MILHELIVKVGLSDTILDGLTLFVPGLAAILDREIELTIDDDEQRVIISLEGHDALNMTFEELEGYVNTPRHDESGLAGDGSGLACPPGVAGTQPV